MSRLVAIFLLLALTGCGFYSSKEAGNKNSAQKSEALENPVQKQNREEPETSEWGLRQLKTYKKDVNILLLGVDSRGEQTSRTDTIMLAKYEPKNKKVKLISLMRDSYVNIPGYKKSKLNHAYFFGGEALLKETIETNFSVDIDHIVLIDFEGFVNIVNLLAPNGIEVEVTKPILNDLKLTGEPGMRLLTGEQLLNYVRFRHDAASDFGRVERQQEVLISLKNEAIKQLGTFEGVVKLPDVLSELSSHIETDIALKDYLTLGATFILNPVSEVETMRIPIENSYTNKNTAYSGEVLSLDLQENNEAIDLFLNEKGD